VAVDSRVEEPGDLDDPPGAKAQQVDRPEPEPLAVRVALVAGEGQLPVRADRQQPPGGGEHPLGEEPADVLAAEEPRGQRRHGEPGVLRQQLQEGRHVGPPPGGHEGVDQLALAVRAEGTQLGLLRGRGHPLADRLPGALQRRDEGQLHALPPQVARRRVGAAHLARRHLLRPGLQPDRSSHRLTEIVGVTQRRAVASSSGSGGAST
jgi:hypothetical protein